MLKTKPYFHKSLIAISLSSFLSVAYAQQQQINNPHSLVNLSEQISAKYSGKNVKLGVLDGGFIVKHPFSGKRITPLKFQLTTPEGELRTYDPTYPQFEVNKTEKDGQPALQIGYEVHGASVTGVISAKSDEKLGFKGGIAKDADVYISTNERKRSLEELLAEAKKEQEGEEQDEKEPSLSELAESDLLIGTDKDMVFERSEWATALNKLIDKKLFAINNSWNIDPVSDDIKVIDKFYQSVKKSTDHPLIQALMNAKEKDALLVFATGNEKKKQPGVMAMMPRYFPELERIYLAVAAVDNKKKITEYSNHCGVSKNWCLTAPGDLHVLNATPDENKKPIYSLLASNGTSIAAPVVTGALAIVKERFDYLTPSQIRDTLLTTATDLGEKGVDSVYGWGLLNVEKALSGAMQFLSDEVVNVSRDDRWTNNFSSRFKFTKTGNKSLSLDGNNTFTDLSVEKGELDLNGKTTATKITNNATLGVNHTTIKQSYTSSNDSQLTVLGKIGVVAQEQTTLQLAGSLKIDDRLTEIAKAGDISANVLQLKDNSSYQGGFDHLSENTNLTARGLRQDLYFNNKGIVAKVNSNKPITDKYADANGQTGLHLLNNLRNSPLAYRRGFYNDWLQGALEHNKLDDLHYAVSNHIYAESIELLRSQNAKGLEQAQHNLFIAYHSPLKTNVWTGHLHQKQSSNDKNNMEIKQHQSLLGVSHKLNDKALLTVQFSQQKDKLNKLYAEAELKQTTLNLGLRYDLADRWFSETAIQFGHQKYRQTRQFKNEQLGKADNRGSSVGGEIRLGYQFIPNQWIIEPSLGLQLTQTKMNNLNETGVLASRTKSIRYNDVNVVPSVKLQRKFQFGDGSISPYIGLSYLHRLNGKTTNINSQIADYTLHSQAKIKRSNYLNSEIGAKLQYKNWFASANLSYDRFKSTHNLGWKAYIGLNF